MGEDWLIDIDHQAPDFVASRHERYAELRGSCPVAYNESYGGFWLVTDYESVAEVARDNETFAHKYEPDSADGINYHGICGIPRAMGTPLQGVSEIDGPDHAELRRALNPAVSPHHVDSLVPRMEEISTWFIDEIIESGSADLVLDYATPVPAVLTLEMMGLPSQNWKHFADFFHAGWEHGHGSAEHREAIGRFQDMNDEFLGYADFRRSNPGDDITTILVNLQRDGRPLNDEEIGGIMWNLVAGGLDTTTSLVGWGLHRLGTDPEQRTRLIEDRALVPLAVEEFLRHYSPNESLTRTATRDVELGGRQIRRGDVVLISWVSANHDPAVFERPDEVIIDRLPNRHIAFGLGGHRCIGSHLARVESALMINAVLDRMPAYELDLSGFRPYAANVTMTGVVALPASFPPGRRVGPAESPLPKGEG